MSDGGFTPNFTVLQKDVNSIVSNELTLPVKLAKRKEVEDKELIFLSHFTGNMTIYFAFGVIAFVAILFDYILSTMTMRGLPLPLPVVIRALIFSIIDCGVAIIASGVFVKDPIKRVLMMQRFRIVLWFLCIVKIALFLFVQFKVANKPSIPATVFMGALVFLVYLILDFAGSGLGLIFGKAYHGIVKFINPGKNTLDNVTLSLWTKFITNANNFKLPINTAIQFFHLNPPDNIKKLINGEN